MSGILRNKLEANLWKITISDVFFQTWFISAIYILFFQFLGFNFSAIGLFEAITSLAIILTDLPTGALGDNIGRKWMVFIANVFMLLLVLLVGFSTGGMLIIVLAGLLNGLEFSFKSGSKTALLYDTLKQLNREDEFLRISGRINAAGTIAKLIGLITGAYLFSLNPRFPYWLWAVFIIVSLFFLALIQEPLHANERVSLENTLQDMRSSLRYIFENKFVLWLVIFKLIADVFAESYWDVFSQAHLKELGADPAIFGVIFAVLAGVTAIASYYVDSLEKKLGPNKSWYAMILVQSGLFFLMAAAQSWLLLVFFWLLFTTSREFGLLVNEYYMNQNIPSANRASILSAGSFLRNGLFGGGLIIWLFGVSVDNMGGEGTLFLAGVAVLVIGLVFLQIRPRRSDALSLGSLE
ncbi:MAG: MFS transporter [Candidatus Thorarchaeota archaeon]